MESKNLFVKGIERDLAVDKIPADFYYDALNMDIVTETGETTGNIRNVKGTGMAQTFPVVPAIFAITERSGLDPTQVSDFTVDINGTIATYTGLYETFTNIVNAINADPIYQAMGVRAYTNEETLYNDTPTIYITLLEGNLSFATVYSLGALFNTVQYAPNQTNIRLIGWVAMRDDFILFTANSVSEAPVNELGQIWRFSYDKQTLQSSLTLLYNNYINLSAGNPIANPTMVEARYETPALQNIYWTDNYNQPRTANVADPMLYSIDPRILGLATIVSPYIPIPIQINQSGGGLKTGIHYLSYRLSRETGGETNFFLQSYPVCIVQANEESDPIVRFSFDGTKFVLGDSGYRGGDLGTVATNLPTTKSITYKIDAVDTNYTRIEFAHIYKKNPSSTPIINIVGNEPVTSSSMEFTVTGIEDDKIALTPEEFNSSNEIFSRVGTMCAKNNYLFFGNVSTEPVDVSWDARAYRFNVNGTAAIKDDVGNTDTIGVDFAIEDVPETHACINPNDEPTSNLNYLYQADGTTLGGEGVNIKYSFIEEQILLDAPTLYAGAVALNPARDVFKLNRAFDLNSSTPVNQRYVSPGTFGSFHSPYMSGFLRGYTRDEIYRFAIVFYDHSHNASFAKWIGDIRMPHMWMPNGPDANDRTLVYPLAEINTTVLAGNSLGIRFDISNLESLANTCSGYSIVRCKRTNLDKTVKGQGLFQPAFLSGGITSLVPATYLFPATALSTQIASLMSPEFLFAPSPIFSTADSIDIVGIYALDDTHLLMDEGGGSYNPGAPGDVGTGYKNYLQVTGAGIPSPITGAGILTPFALTASTQIEPWFNGGFDEFTLDAVTQIENHSAGTTGRAGGRKLVVKGDFTAFGGYVATDGVTGTGRHYIANYKRNLKTAHLSSQYSGNTYSQRGSSEYISTNHYQPMSVSSSGYTNRVYGGDTYVDIMDLWTMFYDTGTRGLDGGTSAGMLTRYFPVETTFNIGMRQYFTNDGFLRIPNKTIYKQDEFPIQFEDFLYNNIFSAHNDIKTFFPKPVPYLPQTEFDCRIYNSALPKINGELVDSWRSFKPEDFIEVDTKYGPITALTTQKNRLFFFQPKALGIYQTNEKEIIQGSTGSEIILGTGGIKERYDYLSERIGCRHKFSISQSPNSTFFFDMGTRRPYLIKDGIKEVEGLNGFFQENLVGEILEGDNPYLFKGLTSIFDNRYDKYLITFHDFVLDGITTQFTLGLNDMNERFVSFYSHKPSVYFTDKDNVFSTDIVRNFTSETIYIHDIGEYGNFYNLIYPSNVTFISNPHPDVEKIFDNFLLNSRTLSNGVDVPNIGFNTMEVWNDYQNTGVKDLDSNRARFIKRKWNVAIGGDQNNTRLTERIKSNYSYNKFEIDNLNNYELILESVLSKFRVNSTML